MDSNDSFLEKLQPLDDLPKLLDRRRRFDRRHKDPTKTLGFLLVKHLQWLSIDTYIFFLWLNWCFIKFQVENGYAVKKTSSFLRDMGIYSHVCLNYNFRISLLTFLLIQCLKVLKWQVLPNYLQDNIFI